MSPNIWMFVRALEIEKQQRAQLHAPLRTPDPLADAAAQRYPPAPIAFN